jgi:hypothetical protein
MMHCQNPSLPNAEYGLTMHCESAHLGAIKTRVKIISKPVRQVETLFITLYKVLYVTKNVQDGIKFDAAEHV